MGRGRSFFVSKICFLEKKFPFLEVGGFGNSGFFENQAFPGKKTNFFEEFSGKFKEGLPFRIRYVSWDSLGGGWITPPKSGRGYQNPIL